MWLPLICIIHNQSNIPKGGLNLFSSTWVSPSPKCPSSRLLPGLRLLFCQSIICKTHLAGSLISCKDRREEIKTRLQGNSWLLQSYLNDTSQGDTLTRTMDRWLCVNYLDPGEDWEWKNKWFSRFNLSTSNNKHKFFSFLEPIHRNRETGISSSRGWSFSCPFFVAAAVLPNRLSVLEALNYSLLTWVRLSREGIANLKGSQRRPNRSRVHI